MEESGWGTRQTGTYNYFGIKARKGEPSKKVLTTENINGKEKKLFQDFRNYQSLEEGLASYVDLLVNNYDILSHGTSMDDYAYHLKQKGYATREDYPKRLSGIYNGRTFRQALQDYQVTPEPELYQFDYHSIPSWQPPISYKKQGGKFYKPKFRWYKQNS